MNPPTSAHVTTCNHVTAHNIASFSSVILKKVRDASFIAIDLEFTGLGDKHPKDMNHRYMAMKKTVETHAIVSIGLSVIKKTPGQDDRYQSYVCDNFHFLTLKQGNFTVNTETGKFLVKHHFSFDRLFADGIPYDPAGQQTLHALWKGILTALAEGHIPLVIHHGLYDLLYLYHSFIGPLPKTLQGFLKEFADRFPSGVYDTKYLVELENWDASFLSFVFARCDRLRQDRYKKPTRERPYFQVTVQEPVEYRKEDKKRKSEGEGDKGERKKRKETKPESYCKQYAERGYCELDHEPDSPLHDIQIIMDHQMGPSDYPQVYTSSLVPTVKDQVEAIQGAHTAHFDAYMTGFAFCYLTHTMTPTQLKNGKNKLKLRGLDIPLTFPTPH
ncbi:hypothetical protein G6F46_000487 [Rhizopus delemar]|uniref:Exonuclease domain-containing protein n=2 Tax=Rhizopus TaxID=4842 RepID=A0A9P6ZA31_9FUNG|nr:hypothetical protein G6F55_005715 [Rhizopus delemar]KAG1545261.1 hypothetical protein G6F51_005571 [Rhizopus arrhizus]KAG1502029.1 hypothetical protein G6F54_002631 [Rhizopus delemar]KAG1517914.1 hypothetical protein G6F53_001008 [Rhizopus delemar]KAG1520656.1 hypothetical protein G6F52_007459 [Rhizopus delemar]